jgi:peptide/nickel transport system permease protein
VAVGTLIARRLLHAPATLLVISVVVFLLIHLAPGDPAAYYVAHGGPHLTAQAMEEFRHARGLDRPLPLQYFFWLRDAAHLDLGISFHDNSSVATRISEALPLTLLLNGFALLTSFAIGVPLGVFLGSRRRSVAREGTHALFLILFALPTFWVALLLMRLFAMQWHLLPLYGMESDDAAMLSGWGAVSDRLRHLVLPVICLSLTQIAVFGRVTSNAIEETLLDDHIRAARARGVTETRILLRHALRNVWTPLISLGGIVVPALLSGSVIIERLFQWNGMGGLLYNAVVARDYPVVMAVTLVTAVAVLAVTLLVDVLYAAADPRVRLEQR